MPGTAAPSNSPEGASTGSLLPVVRELLRFSWRLYLVEDTPRVLLLSKAPRAVLQAVFYTLLAGLLPASGGSGAGAGREAAFTGVSAFVMCLSTVIGASGVQPLDRDERTLAPLLAGRVPPLRILLARCLPYAAEGLLLSLVTVVLAGLVLTGPATVAELLASSGVYAVMALTTVSLGAAMGVLALLGNASLYLILVLIGALPAPALPEWTQVAAGLLPLTHGVAALHHSLAGRPFAGQLLAELGVGILWLAAVAALVRLWDHRTRTRGHADGG
ncbi:ABC transporter permease [Streptomyces avermitilis]|uniref:ABC transporter permease n=1 Tax=Streptomyces avermitilis TaxID=33903 RepID=UPI0033EC88DE